ncbi:APC family permease [Granulicella mallensis]|uniref:Amino acid permease-associated region n=1 Tax=Granulicella mallensis (strain ATCC BAA-1857 / DSM 23137 / MP5ACTX8) TaxID=682795 RepID=G8NPZ8_GRAMM|nr:APC family permease [Granulicella mallensis]AEU38332.1 amino acid permease-associated region [Granulicella mallensis MP5ACTX8]
MRLLPLIGATYFMVAGGPYGLEDIIGKAGYGRALLLLAIIPFLWSLPTSLMVGELASAIPEEGGYYVWVRRALGRFWGFQEAWLSLAASVFDMALYPVTFVLYLSRVAPSWTEGYRGTLWALAVIVGCALWNLKGAKSVGEGSVAMFCLLLSPFVVLVAVALWRWHGQGAGVMLHPVTHADMGGAVSVALWNYMGWDNASTVAQEVDNPQRNYPLAMLGSVTLVAITYILPLAAVGLAGIAADQFSTGAWTDAARTIVGPALGLAVVLGGMINGAGMFNPLMMSYTRVPYAMAEDGLLPRLFLRENRRGAPWISILFCAAIWALALRFSFERLISIDLVLYGAALLLEFVAFIVLRHREPALARPFCLPGGMAGAIAIGICPALLIAFALWTARSEQVLGLPALVFAALVGVAGALVYAVAEFVRRKAKTPSMPVMS